MTGTPLLGAVTRTEKAKANPAGTPTWISAGETTAIDSYGRPTTVKDPRGKLTTTIYTETNMMAPDGSQITSYKILDGFLRTRQTQAR